MEVLKFFKRAKKDKDNLSKSQKFWKEVRSLAFLVVLVFAFRSTFFEPFKIPSGSMIPTLLIGDFILVNKFSYGFKLPFSDMYTDPVYITGPDLPKRGDVIVFKYPEDHSLNYIKRVVGLPGETVEIIDKVVYINNRPILVKNIDGTKIMEDMDDRFKYYNLEFLEATTGNQKHVIQLNKDSQRSMGHFGPRTIPDGHFFVMGDNRDFSSDSRYWGYVPFKNVKGKAILVWFSMIFPWNDSDFKFRPWRIGNLIK